MDTSNSGSTTATSTTNTDVSPNTDSTPITRLVFFDMDGTLIQSASKGSNHVHQDAFGYAMQKVFGSRIPATAHIDDVVHQGKTDCWILSELLTLYGIPTEESEAAMGQLQNYMIEYCQEHRQELNSGIKVIEGIKTILTQLKEENNTILGLVTGNLMRIAMMKVVAAGLDGFFTCGGFGSDARDRAEMIKIGITRALKNNPTVKQEDLTIFHVGDTQYDLDAALRANVKGIGVATGNYSVEYLQATPGNHYAIVPSLTIDLFTI